MDAVDGLVVLFRLRVKYCTDAVVLLSVAKVHLYEHHY